MFDIVRYDASRSSEWNRFVAQSKNGTFLFDRNYMDYHSDRFADHSLMFYRGGRLYAVLPANIDGATLCSHRGLTYGGLVTDLQATAANTVTLFGEMNDYLRSEGVKRVEYKAIPWIYHQVPAEEDLYAMFRQCKMTLASREISTTIFLQKDIRWSRLRRRGVRKAADAGVIVELTDDEAPFWQVLTNNLGTKYGIRPVHTLEEIRLLRSRFRPNMPLYVARKDGQTLGGVMLYLSPQVVHAQYSSATPEGKALGVIDLIYDRIMHHDYRHMPYFDFGKSTEEHGDNLNEPLIFQKEGFGGRGVCYDTYEWTI
ncbi:MAG: GNAT family N-acetyltransferase [Prevotella sp.]|nr:GNAT family N-acetyltransferase [Prevotella sp.]